MKKVILACLVLAVIAALFVFPYPTFSLLFGWIVFLYRTVPRMTVDWPSVIVGLGALLLFTSAVHVCGRAWRRGRPESPRWKLRWSFATVIGIFLLFAAGIALVGIVHQTVWMLSAREPFYVRSVSRGRAYSPNNLHQLGIAARGYADTCGTFAPGGSFTPEGEMLHSWETYCLPFLLYSMTTDEFSSERIDLKLPWNPPRNAKFFRSFPPDFLNGSLPSPPVMDAQGFGLSHYAANVWVLGPNTKKRITDITDGSANTLLIGEVNADFKPWGHPVNWRDPARGINRSPQGFGGPPYAGGAYFTMADGSVRFVSERINPDVLRALSTPAGGESVDASILPSK